MSLETSNAMWTKKNESFDVIKHRFQRDGLCYGRYLNIENNNRSLLYRNNDLIGAQMKNAITKNQSTLKMQSFVKLSTLNTSDSEKSDRKEKRVLVLYTGGTIGMMKNKDGALAPQKGVFQNLIGGYPQLHDSTYWCQRKDEAKTDTSLMVLPESKELDRRIIYRLIEYEILLDSSNITEKEWIQIAEDIMKNYETFDGFVVLHGTDTLSYTASALSFMFENIGKPIVLTGSQIPIFEPRSDGLDNLVSSLLIAGGLNIPEVTVFFGNKLYRGNRTRKISVNNLDAFSSPNYEPLVQVGVDFEINKKAIFKPTVIGRCRLHNKMSKNVGLLRIIPSIDLSLVRAFLQPPIEGVVLESYGAGNMPSNREDLFSEIAAAVKRGMIVVNITQCIKGSVVAAMYETGKFVSECGVVSGYDMTPEAALTKLSYVLSKTELTYQQKVDNGTLIGALALTLNIQSPDKLNKVTEKVLNALLLSAIEHDDFSAVKMMLDMGANMNSQNSEGWTVLHEAILKGNIAIVEYLLKNGSKINLRTRCDETLLSTAIQKGDLPIISLLIKHGASFKSVDKKLLAEMLSQAARTGDIKRIEMLRVAGCDLNVADETGQTLLHKAVLSNNPAVVQYLISQGVDQKIRDALGFTSMDCALKLGLTNIIKIIK